MDSASKVGEIFKKAGDVYGRLGDMVLTLHPAAQELLQMDGQGHKQQTSDAQTPQNSSESVNSDNGDHLFPDVNMLLDTH